MSCSMSWMPEFWGKFCLNKATKKAAHKDTFQTPEQLGVEQPHHLKAYGDHLRDTGRLEEALVVAQKLVEKTGSLHHDEFLYSIEMTRDFVAGKKILPIPISTNKRKGSCRMDAVGWSTYRYAEQRGQIVYALQDALA